MRMMKHLIITAFLCLSAGAAMAEDAKELGSFKNWKAYSFTESGNKACFISAAPTSTEPKTAKRDPIAAMVTHRPAQNANGVFSVITGYNYKSGSTVELKIDGTAFTLFTQGDSAWAKDAEADKQIAAALRSGNKMVITGTSARGTKTVDTYALSGSSSALEAINKECNVQ